MVEAPEIYDGICWHECEEHRRRWHRFDPETFNEHVVEARLRLSANFRETFGLSGGDEDMWEMLFKHAF